MSYEVDIDTHALMNRSFTGRHPLFVRKVAFCAVWYILTAGIPVVVIFNTPVVLRRFTDLFHNDLPTFTLLVTICTLIYHSAYLCTFLKVWRFSPSSSGRKDLMSPAGSIGSAAQD